MKELLEYIVKNLVSKPEEVEIIESNAENMVNFAIKSAKEDIGMIIGKSGQTIKAIRRLLVSRAIAENQGIRVNVNIQEV
ncbi:MAG: KH domain-containing protein [Candidatus Daviesbacteria bacterium]|nr:KH domain-containing protein [Candidatus Daviesbacteria bacterium]